MKIRVRIEKYSSCCFLTDRVLTSAYYYLHVSYRPWFWFWSDWEKMEEKFESQEQARSVAISILNGNYLINMYGEVKHTTEVFLTGEK